MIGHAHACVTHIICVCTLALIPRKFKRGIGSLFDPVLTLWGGGHIGSSRMEQSYCTGFFRQRVTARNHSNYQPRPKRRSIIAYGKRENARHNKMRRSVRYVFFFSCFTLSKLSRERYCYFPVFHYVFLVLAFVFCFFLLYYFHGLVIDMCYP